MDGVYKLIANTSDGVFVVDRDQKIVLWNEAAGSILGYCPGDVLGERCFEIVQGRDAEGCVVCQRGCDAIESAERCNLPPTQDLAVRTKEGNEIWLNVSTVVVPSHDHKLSVLVHLFREVSRQHELARVVGEFTDVVSGYSGTTRARPVPKYPSGEGHVSLTRREREIMGHLMAGFPTKAIAQQLSISPRTVRNHVNNVLAKLGVHSRLEAVTYSIRNGLV